MQGLEIIPSGHVFVELTCLDDLCVPVNVAGRIKYTCLSSSPRHLVLGSSSGSIYLFGRYASKHRPSISNTPLQVVALTEGAVNLLKISPDERYVAVSTESGTLVLLCLAQNYTTNSRVAAEIVLTSNIHDGKQITAMCWSSDSCKFFAGDVTGRVTVTKTDRGKTASYFRSPAESLVQVDSAIVQLDCACNNRLLISSQAKAYLYNMISMNCWPVGNKLRNGQFGACFFSGNVTSTSQSGDRKPNGTTATTTTTISNSSVPPVIFCSRPGSRLWEVDFDGNVYSTHQFSRVHRVPFAPVISYRNKFGLNKTDCLSSVPHFSSLHVISKEFILAVNEMALFVVVPQKAQLSLVTRLNTKVVAYSCSERDLFLLTSDGSLRKLTFLPVQKAASKLILRHHYRRCAELISSYHLLRSKVLWPKDVLKELKSQLEHLPVTDVELRTSIEAVCKLQSEKFEQQNIMSRAGHAPAFRLNSGIHRVMKHPMENSGYEDDFAFDGRRIFKVNASPVRRRSRSARSPLQKSLIQNQHLDASRSNGNEPSRLTPESDSSKLVSNNVDRQNESQNNGDLCELSCRPDQLVSNVTSPDAFPSNALSEISLAIQHAFNHYPPSTSGVITASSDSAVDILVNALSSSASSNNSAFSPVDNSPDKALRIDEQRLFEDETNELILSAEINKNRCADCGIHKSWVIALRIAPLLSKISVASNYSDTGGLPGNMQSWKQILLSHHHTFNVNGSGALCDRCRNLTHSFLSRCYRASAMPFLSGGGGTTATSSSDGYTTITAQSSSVHSKVGKKVSLDREKVIAGVTSVPRNILCGSFLMDYDCPVPMTFGNDDPMVDFQHGKSSLEPVAGKNLVAQPCVTSSGDTRNVDLEVQLILMAKTLGVDSALDFMESTAEFLSCYLSDQFWQVLMCQTPSVDTELNIQLIKLIQCLFNSEEDCKMFAEFTSHLEVELVNPVRTLSLRTDDYCLFCTLQLNSSFSKAIVLFPCGHACHSICAEQNKVTQFCPKCDKR